MTVRNTAKLRSTTTKYTHENIESAPNTQDYISIQNWLLLPHGEKDIQLILSKCTCDLILKLAKSTVHQDNRNIIKLVLIEKFGSFTWSMYDIF